MKQLYLYRWLTVGLTWLLPMARLQAGTKPFITTAPANQTNYTGASVSFTVTAGGDAPLIYLWTKDNNLLSDGGNISGSDTASLTVSNLSLSDGGAYAVLVLNGSGRVTTNAELKVYSRLVANGGFETGDFSGWTRSGNLDDSDSLVASDHAHSGQYGAVLFPPGSPGYLSQILPTFPGESYLVSFWLESDYGFTPNECLVLWNGTNVLDIANVATATWTNIQTIVTATGTSSELKFGFRNDPSYFGFDDVNVMPIPAFRTLTQSAAKISFTWNAMAGFQYQVQYQSKLNAANWSNLNGGFFAETNTVASATDDIVSGAQRFYRLVLQP